ncbi:GTPase Era [Luteimonas sp. FXH3W]|uniref:GTPase Era n=1 Tax=Aquilutibacter rugosus TaxID=3115820 RepID=A0ABU7UZ94_9GAMM
MNTTPFRAGHVAVIGRPNVGKSTLTNALVGAHVAIVSPRPQTTRHRLIGIASYSEGQIVMVDTPGLHRDFGSANATAMHKWMNKAARGALDGVDAALLVVRAGQWEEADEYAYQALQRESLPVMLVINQVDRIVDKDQLLPYVAEVTKDREFAAVALISALKRKGLKELTRDILKLLPEQEAIYPEDEITDKSQRFLAAEMVREQVMRQLGEELPYATTVEIESFEVDGTMLRIGAVIWVERNGQKAIVIGKGGERLRDIGTQARLQMERLFGTKVFLQTWVRVREGWSGDERALRAFGYHD